jgi:hypothetical protein
MWFSLWFTVVQQVKRKLGTAYNEVSSNEWGSVGYTTTISSPLHTPSKGGRGAGRPKGGKNKTTPQTPVSNTGEAWLPLVYDIYYLK